jgi:hypothetical protein
MASGLGSRKLPFHEFRIRLLIIAMLAAHAAVAQQVQTRTKTPAPSSTKAAAQPNLTPQQEQGLRLLKAAASASAGLQPDMHAFVLWQAANAYSGIEPAKTSALLRQAFLTTQSIEVPPDDPTCGTVNFCVKGWLQQFILGEILTRSPKEAEELLPEAEAIIRPGIIAGLVDANISDKNLVHARELLSQAADQPSYPFSSASKLIEALPKENSADRLAVFAEALDNFQQQGSMRAVGQSDFGSLISDTWEKLPADVVLDAVDKVLDEAKSRKGDQDWHMSMSEKGNSVSLNSIYEIRLFQLLQVLQALDPSQADSLLRDNAQARANLQRFPKGMAHPDSMTMGIGNPSTVDGGAQLKQQIEGQVQQRAQLVVDEASKDPQQALSDAMALPMSDPADFGSPRLSALESVARESAKKDPKVAKAALDEIVKMADQLPAKQGMSLTGLPDVYLTMGDVEGAKGAVKVLVKAAEKFYSEDTNPDDPNESFKGQWPSAVLWRTAVQAAAKISPEMAEEIMTAIQDEDIAAFQKISYASSLLGSPRAQLFMSTRHKGGTTSFTMTPP